MAVFKDPDERIKTKNADSVNENILEGAAPAPDKQLMDFIRYGIKE